MEFSISDEAAKTLGLSEADKARIAKLVQEELGVVSRVYVKPIHEPPSVRIETSNGTMTLNRELTRRIDR